MAGRRTLSCSILLLLSTLAHAMASGSNESYCCLPTKWYSQMVMRKDKLLKFLPSGPEEAEPAKPLMRYKVYVNYRRHRFELRSPSGSSEVFWRGHMWRFNAGTGLPSYMGAVPRGYQPSGGFAPFFFRCLAAENGFKRLNDTHYRMTDPFDVRLSLATVTDVHVLPLPKEDEEERAWSQSQRTGRGTCRLRQFSITYEYPKTHPRRGSATVHETHTWTTDSRARVGARMRSLRGYYRNLLRSGLISLNRPHLHVPVLIDKLRGAKFGNSSRASP